MVINTWVAEWVRMQEADFSFMELSKPALWPGRSYQLSSKGESVGFR